MPRTSRPLVAAALAAWLWPLLLHPAYVQNDGDDDRVRACVASLSQELTSRLTDRDYPEELQDSQTQGTVLVRLVLDRAGRVADVAVAETSGDAGLDQAALTAVRRIFPRSASAPSECQLGAESFLTLPLRFEIRIVPGKR
jgi:TonB family protein